VSPRTTFHWTKAGSAPKFSGIVEQLLIRLLYTINKEPVPESGYERDSFRHWLYDKLYHY